jgi:hypothetical protein
MNTTHFLILGIVIIIISLMVQLRKRYKSESERKKKQYEAILKAQKEKRDELIQKGEDPKNKPGTAEITRIPIGAPFSNKFAGTSAQGQLAKLEVEIYSLGRQLIGQLDSKMVAIETLTLEANRTANRLELLIEHFEQITNKLENQRKTKNETETKTETKIQYQQTNNTTKIIQNNSITESTIPKNENTKQKIEPQPINFNDYLNEFETEINNFRDKVDDFGESKEVTILHVVAEQDKKSPNKSDKIEPVKIKPDPITPTPISILTPTATPTPTQTPASASTSKTDPFSLSAPRFPGSDTNEKKIRTNIATNNRDNNQPASLSIDTLFNEPSTHKTTNKNTSITNRKQVEMLANYGYSTKEIAQNLNIPIGEVDLILNTKNKGNL